MTKEVVGRNLLDMTNNNLTSSSWKVYLLYLPISSNILRDRQIEQEESILSKQKGFFFFFQKQSVFGKKSKNFTQILFCFDWNNF